MTGEDWVVAGLAICLVACLAQLGWLESRIDRLVRLSRGLH
jgi:HAMP domain-containing protein